MSCEAAAVGESFRVGGVAGCGGHGRLTYRLQGCATSGANAPWQLRSGGTAIAAQGAAAADLQRPSQVSTAAASAASFSGRFTAGAAIPAARRSVKVHIASVPAEVDEIIAAPTAPRKQFNPDPELLKDYKHAVDMEQFRKLGYEVVDWIADYFTKLETLPVRPSVKPGYLRGQLAEQAPERGECWSTIMQDFNRLIMPGVVHWQHPRFFAYFPANASAPGMLADMLIGALGMIGFSWASSPVSTELEIVMMDWLAQLCGLPQRFLHSAGTGGGGVIQGTSSEAVAVALLAACSKTLRNRPREDRLKLVAYSSDQAHSCFKKACMIAGVTHVRMLSSSLENEFAMRPADLEKVMQADLDLGLLPCFVCATIGTTSSCAVDPVGELADVSSRYGGWMHVDAAYAGSASICPEIREEHFTGLERVDSYSFNPHKWLLTNFDCCAMWVADTAPLKEALSLTPVFLQGVGNALDFKDWQLPLGRRFRALKLYFVMRMYGAESLRQYIRHHIALAQYLADRVSEDTRFEIAATPRFGLVCFRLRGASREANLALLDAVNSSGDMFLIHTELAGQFTIRLAVGSTGTQLVHVQQAWLAIQEAAGRVLLQGI